MHAARLEKLLQESKYCSKKTEFLVKGFKEGFDLGYRGDKNVKMTSPNLKLTVGSKENLWGKVMKEVQAKRYAGPFEQIPFNSYIQSPIGLVPKQGNKTRLIFHLSYPRNTGKSVNANTPEELTSVNYPEFDEAIKLCIKHTKNGICFVAKSDLSAAFRHICMKRGCWRYLVMKAVNPIDNKTYYFVDKCLPFGASISCAIFQAFSDALSHIVEYKFMQGHQNINYLDDFFFVDGERDRCNQQIKVFLDVCQHINFPVSMEKTEWATTSISFLGLLIDTVRRIVTIPPDKIARAMNSIQRMLGKRTTTLRELQKLTGYLNFLCKCVVPGRAFTRRIYCHGEGLLKPHHHLNVNSELKLDLKMWLIFLQHPNCYARPFFHYDEEVFSADINMYTDSAGRMGLGCGGLHNEDWFVAQWEDQFLEENKPSINYLELYAVVVAVVSWIHLYPNRKVTLFCDNMSVVHMINNNASKCRNCMVLIRILVLHSMIHNVKVSAKHVMGKMNSYADLISRMKYREFRRLAKENGIRFANKPTPIPEILWPMDKLWLHH